MKITNDQWMWIGTAGAGALVVAALIKKARDSMSTPDQPSSSSPPDFPSGPLAASAIYDAPRYAPNSSEAIMLFTSAASWLGAPESWAREPGLHSILQKESMGGWVGIPNYHLWSGNPADPVERAKWPAIWDAIRAGTTAWKDIVQRRLDAGQIPHPPADRDHFSSATGLGQLTSTNIRTGRFYPSGLNGIGNALEEAIGMLAYIRETYGDPAAAWARYGVGHEGY